MLRKRSSLFVESSQSWNAMPVMLPPGCASVDTKPMPTGSWTVITIGTVLVAFCTARTGGGAAVTITSGFSATSSSLRELRQPVELALRPSVLDYQLAPLHVAAFGHLVTKRCDARRLHLRIHAEIGDLAHRRRTQKVDSGGTEDEQCDESDAEPSTVIIDQSHLNCTRLADLWTGYLGCPT